MIGTLPHKVAGGPAPSTAEQVSGQFEFYTSGEARMSCPQVMARY